MAAWDLADHGTRPHGQGHNSLRRRGMPPHVVLQQPAPRACAGRRAVTAGRHCRSLRPRAHEAVNAVSWQAGQVRAERHTLLRRSRRVEGTCANQRAESAIRPLFHAAFSCESMEAEHKKVRESVHIGMHDRAEIVCSSRPAHACKAARYAVESGAHSNPTQADGPSEPAPPTLYPQPTSDKLADTAAPSSLITNDSVEPLATADEHGRSSLTIPARVLFERRAGAAAAADSECKYQLPSTYAVVPMVETSHGSVGHRVDHSYRAAAATASQAEEAGPHGVISNNQDYFSESFVVACHRSKETIHKVACLSVPFLCSCSCSNTNFFFVKMIILQFETAEHRKPGTSAPQGEPGPPPSVLTPQSVTMHYNTCGRCRDALPGHYLCCSSQDKCTPALLHRTGGSSIPSGRRRILVQGHPFPPPSHARVAILLQCQSKGNH